MFDYSYHWLLYGHCADHHERERADAEHNRVFEHVVHVQLWLFFKWWGDSAVLPVPPGHQYDWRLVQPVLYLHAYAQQKNF